MHRIQWNNPNADRARRTAPASPENAHPGPPILVSMDTHPRPPLVTVPEGGRMNPDFRPESPTHQGLLARARAGDSLQGPLAPQQPAGSLDMTPEQAAASHMFKQNLDAVDPTGTFRNHGEFGQSYRAVGDSMIANSPMHFQQDGPINIPPRYHNPGTSQIIHSHAPVPGRDVFPSDADYFSAYIHSRGNTNGVQGEMLYHPGADRFYGYQGKINPNTDSPEFHVLINPFDMGPAHRGPESVREIPDPGTYGHHFINWPESSPGTPPAPT